MEKHIEEMAKVIHDSDIADINTFPISMSECLARHGARRTGAAMALFKADYRKQSEVVNKICCEIKQEITASLDSNYRIRGELDVTDDLYHVVNGKISALRGIEGFITEIENKYNKN